MYCRRCGTKMGDDAKFCPNCGTPMAEATPPSARDEEKIMMCTCGRMIPYSWKFCPYDGMSVEDMTPLPPRRAPVTGATQSASRRAKRNTGKAKGTKRHGVNVMLIIILVVIVTVILGSAATIYLLGRDDGAAEETNVAVSESAETQSTAITQNEADETETSEDEDAAVVYKTLSLPATYTYMGTSGETRSYTEYAYEWSDNTLAKTWYAENGVWYEYVYDSDENLLSRTYYEESDDGSWWEKYIFAYTYDSWGNVLTMSQTCYWYEDGEYGSEGPEMMWEFEYICDDTGNCLNSILYYPDGTIGRKDEYIYDETGNCLSKICYDSDDEVLYWYEYTYDEAGNCLIEIYYNSDGMVESRYEYTYDADGNCLTGIIYNYDGTEDRFEYTYLTMEVAVTE